MARDGPLVPGPGGAVAAVRTRLLLAVDTAGDGVSLALGDGVRSWGVRRAAARADEALWPALESLLKKAGARLGDLGGVACVTGPGRFTAVRVGVTFAGTLAGARGLETAGFTRFEACAPSLAGADDGLFGLVVPALRDESYLQLWRKAGERLGPAAAPVWVPAGGLPAALGDAARVDASSAGAAELLLRAPARLSKAPLEPLYLKPANYAK